MERGRRLKEQFINSINDQTLTAEIIKELTTITDNSKVMIDQVLSRASAKWIEAQWSQKVMLQSFQDSKECNMVRKTKHRTEFKQSKWKQNLQQQWQNTKKCKYCSTLHQPRQCPECGKYVRNAAESRRTPVHEVQQSNGESWQNSDDQDRQAHMCGNYKFFSFNSIRSTIITVSDGNLMPVNIFKILFHVATMEQLRTKMKVSLWTYNKTCIT